MRPLQPIVWAVVGAACIRMPALDTLPPRAAAAPAPEESTTYEPFQLKPDFAGPCARAEVVDVNLGHSPQSFVRAAHCQIAGEPAPPEVVEQWVGRMRDAYYVRRI